jgi:hypothetical protein
MDKAAADKWVMATKAAMHTDTHKNEDANNIADDGIFGTLLQQRALQHCCIQRLGTTTSQTTMRPLPKKSRHNCIKQCKSERQDGDGYQRHQNSKDATYGNDGRRVNATKNVCGALMSGIARAKAVHSGGRGNGRSALTPADNNDNAMYGNKAVNKNKASTTTMMDFITQTLTKRVPSILELIFFYILPNIYQGYGSHFYCVAFCKKYV